MVSPHSLKMDLSSSRTMFVATILLAASTVVDGFSSPVFQETHHLRKQMPSKTEGVEIELPNFDELFGRIRQVSPLADKILSGDHQGKGLQDIDDTHPIGYQWKTVESNKRRVVHQVDRIDNFQELGAPLLRFRSNIQGPHVPEKFANLIMNLDDRSRWDPAIAEVDERYPVYDLDAANMAMGVNRYGDCSKLGVGYCRTKQSVVSPREQLTLCGIQDFDCGSSLIWGTEMEEWHNHLLPGDKRHTRAKSHLFSVALTPTGPDSFDVEYILQLEIGGSIPKWMTAPIVSESVKNMFNHAKDIYGGKDGEIDAFIKELEAQRAKEVVLETAAASAVEDILMEEVSVASDNIPDATKEEMAVQTEIAEGFAAEAAATEAVAVDAAAKAMELIELAM